jgi:hypothetical protein
MPPWKPLNKKCRVTTTEYASYQNDGKGKASCNGAGVMPMIRTTDMFADVIYEQVAGGKRPMRREIL